MRSSDSRKVAPYARNTDKYINCRNIVNTPVVNRVDEILRLCRGKRVIHFGCADYPFTEEKGDELLHIQLSQVADVLVGVDSSKDGIEKMRSMGCTNVILEDVEHLTPNLIPRDFDIILAGEIIEHLACPANFLNSIRSIMSRHTEIVLTTPNAFALKLFVHSFLRREKVHQDHNYYFSYYTIMQLLEKFDFRCNHIYYCQEVNGKGFALFVDRLFALLTGISPCWADTVFVRATIDQRNSNRSAI